MKVWLYYRLSRDEDEELNSLNNQRKIIYNFAISNGHQVVGESFDDNVSGMHFNREGIDKIYEVVEAGKIEAIIVKDLSRLGRHRTQTALFIDYLREHNVRVLSATENIDTFNENDDLIIGFKGLVNDFYARDGSRRVRTGYRQKQKEGIVTIPPFGYFKDKNTKKVVVVEEAAETVRMIFSAYTDGSGMKAIARTLNEQRRKTPALMQMELLNKRLPNTQDGILKKYLWDATMVGRILKDESYIGTLICHKSERNKINKTFRFTDPEEQFRHENYLPVIVTRETWELAQTLLVERKAKNTRAGTNKGILRYGGLLRCQDCGRTFIGKRIKLKDGERVVYVCDTYHRYGKEHCSSHMVDEETLDRLISAELLRTKKLYQENWSRLEWLIEKWTPKASVASAKISKLQEHILLLEEEVEVILMERIRDKVNAERYDRMIAKREEQIAEAKKQIEELQNISEMLRSRQAKLKRDIRLIDDILQDGEMSEAHLKMLVEKILVHEEDGKLDLEIRLKAPFRDHLDIFENGEQTDSILSADFDYDRLGAIIYGDYYAG
ncbi:MAG: recombinase family protein [Flintibacter sp.]|uniref:recombinase family protein n=1 Tax=Flintibacter sp. TaxID=1918624 RepID=UPI002672D85D|nr:recombinase family protein [Flintibacter sp.]MCI6149299.1 recombinase family protein [Flintibacter sp.]MDY5038186.1 recombinase family protein [Lawsonibacter sp.]